MPKSKQTTKQKTQKSKSKKKESDKQASGKKNDFQKQVNDPQDKHLRLKAEFENFRRRKSDEISKLLQFEGETVIKGFLPILDDLERMVESKNSSEESLLDGIELVKNRSENFEDLNVESFGQKGRDDGSSHPRGDADKRIRCENDAILEVFEKGYTYRDKVIRHAKVIVNKK